MSRLAFPICSVAQRSAALHDTCFGAGNSAKVTAVDWQVCIRQYCAEISEAARNRMELIVPELAKRNGVTEKLKAENQMEWIRQMNACKAQAEEIVKAELIYD